MCCITSCTALQHFLRPNNFLPGMPQAPVLKRFAAERNQNLDLVESNKNHNFRASEKVSISHQIHANNVIQKYTEWRKVNRCAVLARG